MILDWYEITIRALIDLWQGFIIFLPKIIGALIVFLIGLFVASGLGKLITEILKRLKFNQIFERGDWKTALEKAELKIDASGFIGAICKWILVIVFLLAAVEILGLVGFASFLTNVLNYLPNVVVASFIFVVAVIIADILEKLVRTAVERVKVGCGQIVGVIVKWSIWIFAAFTILEQLIPTSTIFQFLFQTILTGIIGVLVIGFGLAFGLGGKEVAAEILEDLKKKLRG